MEIKSNMIWIVTDQQRAETLSINGCENASTPHLDMLARTGVNLTSAISGTPLCCPFRGSMLTSVYPHKCVPGHEYQLNPNQQTIAHAFNEQGYDTFYLGKWHLDGAKEAKARAGTHIIPKERRGRFKSWLGYENNNAQYDCYLHGHKKDQEIPLWRLNQYETDELTDIFINYLQEKAQDEEPFFAVISVQPPHDPYVAPPQYQKGHNPAQIRFRENVPHIQSVRKQAAKDLAGYYAMVENIDDNVGRIINTLEQTGLMNHTHIMYFSDHGDMHGSHGQFRKTIPYQEAINIPCIISGEKRGAYVVNRGTGERDDILINHVDFAPTALGLCGIEVPSWMEGMDYSAVRLQDKKEESYPDSAFLQMVVPTCHGDSINKAWRGIVTKDGYKYVCFEGMDWMLFDLNEDPYEQMNLAHNDNYKELRERVNQRLREWIDQTGDSFKMP